MFKLSLINRLRVAHLLLGMMFFYGIEQLFLDRGVNNVAARGYVSIVYTATVLLLDVPTGVLADKIGRKTCLLAACVVQAASLVVLGASHSLDTYLLGSALFGFAISLWEGASQAVLYDGLLEKGEHKLYARQQGRMYAAFLIGAGIANIASGFIAHAWGLRSPYFLSIIPACLALLVLIKMQEPAIKEPQDQVWYKHIGTVLREVSRHRKILLSGIHMAAAMVLFLTIGEFGQIYMLSFGISTVTLGILWAIDAAFAAGGRLLAHRWQNHSRSFVLIFCAILACFSLAHRSFGIGLFWLIYGSFEALQNIAETEIQHLTRSNVRATTLSVVNFFSYAITIPAIYFYNRYYVHHGIFAANKVVIIPVVIVLIATVPLLGKLPAAPKATT